MRDMRCTCFWLTTENSSKLLEGLDVRGLLLSSPAPAAVPGSIRWIEIASAEAVRNIVARSIAEYAWNLGHIISLNAGCSVRI